MEEIDISQLLNYFKSKIIYILFAMAVAFCLSSIYVNRFRIPEYTSSTTILLNQASDNVAINSTDINLNKSLVTTYGEIIKSKRVLRQVIETLDLDLEYGELAAKVSVGEITDTSIIRISVTDEDNILAADIANAIAEIFAAEIVDIYNIENISIIDEAEVSEVASSTSTIKIIGIVTLAGAFISIVVIFVIFYFDTTLKNEDDIEKATGLPVIGIVPSSREKIKGSAHRKYYDDLAKKHKTQEILPVEREMRRVEVNKEFNKEKEIGVSVLPTVEKKKEDTKLKEDLVVETKKEEKTEKSKPKTTKAETPLPIIINDLETMAEEKKVSETKKTEKKSKASDKSAKIDKDTLKVKSSKKNKGKKKYYYN